MSASVTSAFTGTVPAGTAGPTAGAAPSRTRFVHGRVLTEDPARPEASAFVVEGERIVWVGPTEELPEAYAGSAYAEVDLGGARVMPGFVDAHMHALMLASYAKQISALPPAITSIEDLVDAIRARRAKQGPDRWIEGWGYDESLLAERRPPTRWDLDRGCADAPVCIIRTCSHIRCVNSRALELAGIDRTTPDPPGGEIERDVSGEPTGVLKESARDLVTPVMPKRSTADAVADLVDLGHLLASQGIVAATDLCTLNGQDAFPYLEAAVHAGMPQDLASYVLWDDVNEIAGYTIAPELLDRSRRAFMAGVKVLTDGSVSGRTAWFDEPYLPLAGTHSEDTPTYGISTCSDANLDRAIAFCQRTGCQLSAHAMGTRAIDHALERVLRAGLWDAGGVAPLRIEHVTAPSASAIETMARLRVPVVTQPIFAYCETGSYLANLGKERTRRSYPLRTLMDAGVPLVISTDAPATSWATPSDPFTNIKAAVTRRAHSGFDLGQREALTVEEALCCYTREAARVIGFEGLGQIAPGYKASFIVLDRDILAVPASELDQVCVQATYIRGQRVV